MKKPIVTNLPHSEVEISGEISADAIAKARVTALKEIQKGLELPGFRKGNVPESMIVKQLGETAILEEAAEIVIQKEFPEILKETKLDIIGRPQVIFTKIAPGNPAEYKIKAAIVPVVTVGDYQKLAAAEMKKPEEKLEAKNEEMNEVIMHIRKNQANEQDEKKLPELTDALVQALGDFKDVADFKEKLRANILSEKKYKQTDQRRAAMMDKIVDASSVDLPHLLVESELHKMAAQFEDSLAQSGIKLDDYLKHIKKSMEEIRAEWKGEAEKRAKTQLVMNKIATLEKLAPTPEEIAKEAKHIMDHYKDARIDSVAVYVETILTNNKVVQFLESQGK